MHGRWTRTLVACLAWGALGCGGDGSDLERPSDNAAPVTRVCNVVSDVCLLPYPSSLFTEEDPATPTGLRVAIPQDAAFEGFSVESFNARDGYPPVTGIVTHFPEGLSADGLPSLDDRVAAHADSMARGAPIVLANADITSPHYGERIPYFAEAFASAEDASEALLVITPLQPLAPSTRIAVIVTDAVRDPGGTRLAPNDTMALLLGDERPEGDLGPLWDYYRDLRYLAERELGIRRNGIVQMWDFHTRSDEGITSDLMAMREEVQAWLGDHPPSPTITSMGAGPGSGDTIRYDFEYTNPIFREAWNTPLHRDASGRPAIVREDTLRGIVLVPAEGADTLVPFVFGHGFGQSASGLLSLAGGLDLTEGPYALATFDWDLHGLRGAGASDFIALISPDTLDALSGVFQQSAVDELVFAANVQALNGTAELAGRIDPTGHMYAGVSMGAVFGTLVTAIDDRIRASVLNVGGGGVIDIVRFSSLFDDLGVRDIFQDLVSAPGASTTGLPSDLDAEILLLAAQFAIDDGDSINYGPHLIRDRFPDMPAAPPIVLQESMGDGIVPNFTTEALARAAGLPLVGPAVTAVPGLDEASAPTLGDPAQGLTQFRVFPEGIAAHVALGHMAVQRQLLDLFASVLDGDPDTDGNITYSCGTADGSCDLLQ
jgi:hypothetical protein